MRLQIALAASLLMTSVAHAQGPISVGLPGDEKLKAQHCTAALMAEAYLIKSEGRASALTFTQAMEAGEAWARTGAQREGTAIDAYMSSDDMAAVTELKAGNDAQRQKQAAWCLANKPG